MSTVSSSRSAPPPYSTLPPPNLDAHQAGQIQQRRLQHPQQFTQPYQQLQQFPTFQQDFIPQPLVQPLFYQPHFTPLPFFHPFSPALRIPISYPIPFPSQPIQPLHINRPEPQALAPTYSQNNMIIIPAPTQAGFVPHPPAIIPGIPGVHQYPLFVRKEGQGPPLLPIFVGAYPF